MTKTAPSSAMPLPSRGGHYVFENGELREQQEQPTPEPVNAVSNDPLNAAETPPETNRTED